MDSSPPSCLVTRAGALERLATEDFDVLVVGGGITGAGVALDAATRGLRVAIVDRGDWASGTSSKSSKLVHGGLRYLQQKEYRLVYENLRERQRLLRNAPHLVRVMPFLIPLFAKQGIVTRTVAKGYSTALTIYDITGGWRIGKFHKRVSVEETVAHMGGLSSRKVAAGFIYFDAQADDARLTLAIIRTAMEHGAVAVNYCGVRSFESNASGRICAAQLDNGSAVRARCVVNAAGVWAAQLAGLTGTPSFEIRPAKGCHITVPFAKVRADIAAVLPVRSDRRSIFVVPAYDTVGAPTDKPSHLYVGTTDTEYDGPLDDVRCTTADVKYLLDAMNEWIEEPLLPADVVATWAGLRPLLSDATSVRTADLSRRHRVVCDPSGLISILGGKLTTYRAMAQDTVDEVVRTLGIRARCRTRSLRLYGAGEGSCVVGVSETMHVHLQSRYGSEATAVEELIRADPTLGEALVVGLAYVRAEALYAVRSEQARTLDDVLARRTRCLLLDLDATANVAHEVAALIAPELGWSEEDTARELVAFDTIIERERTATIPGEST